MKLDELNFLLIPAIQISKENFLKTSCNAALSFVAELSILACLAILTTILFIDCLHVKLWFFSL